MRVDRMWYLYSDKMTMSWTLCRENKVSSHYDDVIMTMLASQITSLTVVYSIVYSGVNQKKTSKLRVTGLCAGNSPGTGEFPAQMASYAENVSIWWRHHDLEHQGTWWYKVHVHTHVYHHEEHISIHEYSRYMNINLLSILQRSLWDINGLGFCLTES